MPRSSRRKSHRSHKHSRDSSDSEDGKSSRNRRSIEEEPAASSGVGFSRDPDPEKLRSMHPDEGKEMLVTGNDDLSLDHAKKRKETVEKVIVDYDRWNGGEDDGYKRAKLENFGQDYPDKSLKAKLVASDGKVSCSCRRHESLTEINEESTIKTDSERWKSEKDLSCIEGSSAPNNDGKERDRGRGSGSVQHKDGKEGVREPDVESFQYKDRKKRENRERASEYKDGKERSKDQDNESDHYKTLRDRDRERVLESVENVKERDKDRVLVREKEHAPGRERGQAFGKNKERGSGKEKERGSERDRERNLGRQGERNLERQKDKHRMTQDDRNEISNDLPSRQHGSKVENSKEDHSSRLDMKINEMPVADLILNPDSDKGIEKQTRGDHSEDKDKWLFDGRGGNDRRLFTRDDYSKHRIYKDESYEDVKHRDKNRDDSNRHEKPWGDRCHGEHSRDHGPGRSDSKHVIDENKHLNSWCKRRDNRNKQDGGSYGDDLDVKAKDSMRRKRYSNDIEAYSEENVLSKEPSEDQNNLSNAGSTDSYMEKPRPEHRRIDSSPRNRHKKGSGSSSSHSVKEHNRGGSKPVDVSKYERVKSKSDQRKDKSPSSNSDWRPSERTGQRLGLDIEKAQKVSSSKDRGQTILEKEILDDGYLSATCNMESTPAGSSIKRAGHFSGRSPNHLFAPPHFRTGNDSQFVGFLEDDNRSQMGDRKPYNRYMRNADVGVGRGHSHVWNSAPLWPSPLGNGLIPLQHAPTPVFHQALPQFPGSPLFGIRPSVDLAYTGVSFHMHDMIDNFSGQVRPFGWHNAVEQQVWGASNAAFCEESHIFGRPDWDQNLHLLGSGGWEVSTDLWKGQNDNANYDMLIPKKEAKVLSHLVSAEAQVEFANLEYFPTESIEAAESYPLTTNAAETRVKPSIKKALEPSTVVHNEIDVNYSAVYLSKIDISPILANSELYNKCTSLLDTPANNGAWAFAAKEHSELLGNKDGNSGKIGGNRHKLSSLFPTPNDTICQRAMSLYKIQKEGLKVKLTTMPVIRSEEEETGKAIDDEVKDVDDQALLEKTTLTDATTSSDTEPGGSTPNQRVSVLADEPEGNLPDFGSVALIFANDSQACESLTESRIHDSPESTH